MLRKRSQSPRQLIIRNMRNWLRSCHECAPSQLLTGRSLAGQTRFNPRTGIYVMGEIGPR